MYNFCVHSVNCLWTYRGEVGGDTSPTNGLVVRFMEGWWGELKHYTKTLNSFSDGVSTFHPHKMSPWIGDFLSFSTATIIKDTVARFIKRKE